MFSKLQAYLIGAGILVLVLTGMAAAIYKYRGDAIGARAEAARLAGQLQTAIDVNRAQEATIGRMRAQAEADAKGAAELAEELRLLNENVAAINEERRALKDSDATVKEFLDTPIPDALRGLRRPVP